jgi:orotidine-5'-phosphate decarboxylase
MKHPKDYIVFPLDVSDYDSAMSYIDLLKDHVGVFKIGLELFISEGPAVLDRIRKNCDNYLFLDLKLHDIPVTVKRSLLALSGYKPNFVTVHCDEGGAALKEAAENNPSGIKILAITVLTSLGSDQLELMGYSRRFKDSLSDLVLLKAKVAKEAGCHGVVCSGLEVARIKKEIADDIIAVCPGIRPAWSVIDNEDQRRVITPGEAVRNGADYIVIGRPIRDASDPAGAAMRVADEIGNVCCV